jgi:Protein kinase domain
MPPMTGRVIAGRYNLQSPIGRGAMGVVWRARDQLLDREVAVKEVIISALIGADERRNAYQRTLREARTAARLSHRGVVAVYDVAEEDGRPWIIMELVPSQALDQLLTVERRLLPLRAGRIGQQLLSALAHAHSAGVLHRDVKPSNVLIANERSGGALEERAVLTDFGIAQFEGDPRLTQTGMVMGSPGFTAPERIRGGDATPASDLWSLGATLYAAVEGRGPYEQRGGAITTMSAIINEDAPVAAHAGRLAPLIAALLRREPRDRPSAMAASVMFSQILPVLAGGEDARRAPSHPPTMHSPQVGTPARPVASAPASPAAPAAKPAPAAADAAVDAAKSASGPERPAKPTPPTATTPDDPEPALARAAADAASRAAAAAAAADGPADMAAVDAGPDDDGIGDVDAVAAVDHADDFEAAHDSSADAAPAAFDADVDADHASADIDADSVTPAEPSEDADDEGWNDDSGVTRVGRPDDAVEADDIAAAAPDEAEERELEVAAAGAGVVSSAKVELPAPELPPPPGSKPAPTFTAAKPGERSVPTFSASQQAAPAAPPSSGSRPPQSGWSQSGSSQSGSAQSGQPQAGWSQSAQPQSGQPQSGWSQSGQPPAGWAPSGGNASGWAAQAPLGTTPLPDGGASYAGPSQAYPDLAAQYTPGSGGGRAVRTGRRGRGRLIALIAAAIVVAAGIGAGTAYALGHHSGSNNNLNNTGNNTSNTTTHYTSDANAPGTVLALNDPSTAVPTGWVPYTVTGTQEGTTAGFTIDLPPGWSESQKGFATEFSGPDNEFVEIDLTKHTFADALLEAQYVERTAGLADYHRVSLERQAVRGTHGSFWKFTFDLDGTIVKADDIFFISQTPNGAQSYAVYVRTTNAAFNVTLPFFEKILRTFQTVPATTS